MKITAPNTTQIPNVIFDYWMAHLSPGEFKILMCICRKTFGWHKERDKISRAQIVEMTGLSRDGVRKSLATLEEYGLIIKTEQFNSQGDNDPNLYEIMVDDEKKPGVGDSVAQGLATEKPTGRLLSSPTKERPTKQNIQNIYAPPSGVASEQPSSLLSDATKKKNPKAPFRTVHLKERLPSHPMAEKFKNYFESPLIGIDDQDHQELIAEHGEKIIQDAYLCLANWKLSKAETKPKVLKEHTDLARLRKWAIKEVKDNPTAVKGLGSHRAKWAIEADSKPLPEMAKRPYAWGMKNDEREKELMEYLTKVKKQNTRLGRMSIGMVDELEKEMLEYLKAKGVEHVVDSL